MGGRERGLWACVVCRKLREGEEAGRNLRGEREGEGVCAGLCPGDLSGEEMASSHNTRTRMGGQGRPPFWRTPPAV